MTQGRIFEIQSKRHKDLPPHRNHTYQRASGTMTTLSVWQTTCVKCGTSFHVTTPANACSSKAFETVHCPEHRKSPNWSGCSAA
jgi:hypothetical protein